MSEQVVKRYADTFCESGGESWSEMQECPDGAYVRYSDYDALHAEAEALRVALLEIASVNPAHRGIEWAKSYASDGLKGAGSELYARWLDTFKEAEALRAENWHWKGMHASSMALRMSAEFERDELRTEREEARGLLRELRALTLDHDDGRAGVLRGQIDAFLTATTSPDVPDNQE